MLLIVLTLSLSLNGCGWLHGQLDSYCPECKVKVETVYHYTHCPVDEVPNYVELRTEDHIGSVNNVNILIPNLEILTEYNKSLINTIKCYEKQQVEKPNED